MSSHDQHNETIVRELVEEVTSLPPRYQLEVVRQVLERMSPENRARVHARTAELLRDAP